MLRKFWYKKLGSLVCVMCVCVAGVFAQTELTNLNTTWSTVLGGRFIHKPQTTSYGFISVTDGRTICAVSNNGVVLWEKRIFGASNPILATISDDFTVAITNSNTMITLYNPSGVGLWTRNTDWEITEKPYEGRDGRFFLRGKNNLCCYGINGICKWEITTAEQNDIPIQELSDGSLVVFLTELSDDGKTKGLRISPFGTVLEEIIFSGVVVNSATCTEGILLTFTDGSAGMFSLDKSNQNNVVNKWVIDKELTPYQNSADNFFASNKDYRECYFLSSSGSGVNAIKIDSKTGIAISDFNIPNIDLKKITNIDVSANGFFIMDEKRAYFFNEYDSLNWEGILPDKKTSMWNYAFFSTSNSLILAYENWTIDSYLVHQSVSKSYLSDSEKNYNSFYNIDKDIYQTVYKQQFNADLISEERLMSLKSGFYGEDEITFVSDAESMVKAYLQHLNSTERGGKVEKSIFSTNTKAVEKVYLQLAYFGSDEMSREIAKLISSEKNLSLLNSLLTGIQKNGYDPTGEILDAIEAVSKSSSVNTTLASNICDAVYAICRFNGRPAFNKNGKQILMQFLSTKTNQKAQDTLKALGDLDL